MSTRTVDHHVSATLTKLDVRTAKRQAREPPSWDSTEAERHPLLGD
jgi:hypothetical protein